MNRTYSKFTFLKSKLHYTVYGQGQKVLLMFHGFGHTLKNMRAIEEAMSPDYKIYNFDLFFHGFSEWNDSDSPLTQEYWHELLSAFFKENNIDKFSLLGFSLGAKIALATVELFPDKVENLYLLAPDGLKHNFWYRAATARISRRLFRYTILKPHLFYGLANTLGNLKLLDKSSVRFSTTQMSTREKRRRVYYSWIVFKDIAPNMKAIVAAINKYDIHTELFGGMYDRIIPPEGITKFAKKLKKAQVKILNSGHNNLLDKVADFLGQEIAKR